MYVYYVISVALSIFRNIFTGKACITTFLIFSSSMKAKDEITFMFLENWAVFTVVDIPQHDIHGGDINV